MNVYWVNCFLACTLSFVIGYWYAERKFKFMLASMLSQTKRTVTSDVSLH
jgi:hypothetical protein